VNGLSEGAVMFLLVSTLNGCDDGELSEGAKHPAQGLVFSTVEGHHADLVLLITSGCGAASLLLKAQRSTSSS